MIRYRKTIVPHKYPMNFIFIINVWIETLLLALKSTTELYSWCSVRVEKEGIQMVEQAIRSVWMMCRGIGQTFQFTMVGCMT
jgi:hypothetical protein